MPETYTRKIKCRNEIRIKRDFLKHKTVKTNDKIRRFGVVMTQLKGNMNKIMQIRAFKAILARRINIRGREDYKYFRTN